MPPTPPLDVPDGGLMPTELLTAYNVDALAAAGFTGAGMTVAVFAFDGFDQHDMDSLRRLVLAAAVHPGSGGRDAQPGAR